MTIGDRLKAERERLGFSQTQFGLIGGVGKTTVIAWERGTASPNAAFLAAVAERGLDVLYVLTGSRSFVPPVALSSRARALLDNYEAADESGRRTIEGVASLASQPKKRSA